MPFVYLQVSRQKHPVKEMFGVQAEFELQYKKKLLLRDKYVLFQ